MARCSIIYPVSFLFSFQLFNNLLRVVGELFMKDWWPKINHRYILWNRHLPNGSFCFASGKFLWGLCNSGYSYFIYCIVIRIILFISFNTYMKNRIVWIPAIFVGLVFLSSCAERRYYKTHNKHSERYYRHHPNKHVEVDIKIRP